MGIGCGGSGAAGSARNFEISKRRNRCNGRILREVVLLARSPAAIARHWAERLFVRSAEAAARTGEAAREARLGWSLWPASKPNAPFCHAPRGPRAERRRPSDSPPSRHAADTLHEVPPAAETSREKTIAMGINRRQPTEHRCGDQNRDYRTKRQHLSCVFERDLHSSPHGHRRVDKYRADPPTPSSR